MDGPLDLEMMTEEITVSVYSLCITENEAMVQLDMAGKHHSDREIRDRPRS